MSETRSLDKAAIEEILPHRGRALMLDRAEVGDGFATGFFTVTEEVCEGHLPGRSIFKATDRVEVLFLTLAVAVGKVIPQAKIAVPRKAKELDWPGEVRAGQEVRAEVVIHRLRTNTVIGSGVLYVGDQVVCTTVRLIGMIVDTSELK